VAHGPLHPAHMRVAVARTRSPADARSLGPNSPPEALATTRSVRPE
jgi:hypothetical protein